MIKKQSKRVWSDLGKKDTIKNAKEIVDFAEKGQRLAREGMMIMRSPIVQEWKMVLGVSRNLGPELTRLAKGKPIETLYGWHPELDKDVNRFIAAEFELQNPEFANEAKAMLKKADEIFAEAKRCQAAAISLKMEGGVA